MTFNGSNCFHAFLNSISEQKSKVRLLSKISEFSYLALGQIRKLGNLGKIFLSIRNALIFISNYDFNGSNCFHACLDRIRAKE